MPTLRALGCLAYAETKVDSLVEEQVLVVDVLVMEDFGRCFGEAEVVDGVAGLKVGAQLLRDVELALALQEGLARVVVLTNEDRSSADLLLDHHAVWYARGHSEHLVGEHRDFGCC